MPGKRSLFFSSRSATSEDPRPSSQSNGDANGRPGDPMRSKNHKSLRCRYRDHEGVDTKAEDARREELKRELLNEVDHNALEQYRKSEEELKAIKNKGVRKFYEAQNDRINDWLEIDAVVMAIGDDVLESMRPDADGDGYDERQGGIQDVRGDVERLLPDDERQKRAKSERQTKIAINVVSKARCASRLNGGS